MRIPSLVLALVAVVACNSGDPVVNLPAAPTVVGSWSLQTYNGGALPYSGSANADGSINKVTAGTITLDNARSYVLDIRIVNTLGAKVQNQDYSEIGSYASNGAAGIVLRPNDLSGGTAVVSASGQIPVTVNGKSLSFSQQGKILTFVKP